MKTYMAKCVEKEDLSCLHSQFTVMHVHRPYIYIYESLRKLQPFGADLSSLKFDKIALSLSRSFEKLLKCVLEPHE